MSDGCKLFVYGVDQYMENEELSVSYFIVTPRAGEPEPVGAGCFWLLGAGAGAA